MMKNIAFIGLLLCFCFAFVYKPVTTIDTYKVIKVSGNIVYKKNNKSLAQGDLFPENEQIVFKTVDSKAAVISTIKGRFILAAGEEKKSDVKANLLPASSNVSSRSGAVINIIDLQNAFTGNYVVLGKSRIHINKDNFPMNEKSFFFLRYKYKGEEISKKLDFEGEKLILDKTQIMSVDGKAIEKFDSQEVKLYYLTQGNSPQLINTFNLFLPDDNELKKETQILLDEIKDKSYSAKVDEFLAYLNDFYGKANKQNAMDWLKTNFNIEP